MMSIRPKDLVEARLELHHAVQLLASFGQTHVPAREDDSHRSMTWDPEARAFLSEPTEGDAPSVRGYFRPVGLTVGVRVDGEDGPGFSLVGRTLDEAYVMFADHIGEVAGGPGSAPLGRPEYEMPGHAVAEGAAFTGGAPGHLEALAEWYAGAYENLELLVNTEEHVTEVRCWPHHFDIAVLMLLDPEKGAADGRSVGVGMSPGDGGYAEPYWYVTPYPAPVEPVLAELPSGGRWHTEGWFGGVLTGSAVTASAGDEARSDATRVFLAAAVSAARAML